MVQTETSVWLSGCRRMTFAPLSVSGMCHVAPLSSEWARIAIRVALEFEAIDTAEQRRQGTTSSSVATFAPPQPATSELTNMMQELPSLFRCPTVDVSMEVEVFHPIQPSLIRAARKEIWEHRNCSTSGLSSTGDTSNTPSHSCHQCNARNRRPETQIQRGRLSKNQRASATRSKQSRI